MTAPPPRRPWWKRKRTWAAVAVWLVAGYVLSFGPLMYLNNRGRFPGEMLLWLYTPVGATVEGPVGQASGYYAYLDWWADLGKRHRASD